MLSPVLKITFRAERRFEMAYVTVPKDLTKIKSKVMFNLTKRQLICFSAAVAIGLKMFEKAKAEKESRSKNSDKLSSKPTFDIEQIERDALNNFEI